MTDWRTVSRQCGLCRRIGTAQFTETTNVSTGWVCLNDRACQRRTRLNRVNLRQR